MIDVVSGNCLRGFMISQVLLCGQYAGILCTRFLRQTVRAILAFICEQQYHNFENGYAGLRKIHVLLLRGVVGGDVRGWLPVPRDVALGPPRPLPKPMENTRNHCICKAPETFLTFFVVSGDYLWGFMISQVL